MVQIGCFSGPNFVLCTKYIFSLENYTQLCSGEKKTPVISVMTEGSEGAMPGARGWARRRLALGAAAVCAVVLLAVTSSLSYYHPVVVYSAGYGHLVATASASHLRRSRSRRESGMCCSTPKVPTVCTVLLSICSPSPFPLLLAPCACPCREGFSFPTKLHNGEDALKKQRRSGEGNVPC